jgi:hypothetical protein
MRGASSAAGAADYTLSLRYANGTFGTRRKLSGRGRFVNVAPILMDYDDTTGQYTALAEDKDPIADTTWRLICEMGALTTEPRSVASIASAAGLVDADGRPTKTHKRQVSRALANRDGVFRSEKPARGGKAWHYQLATEVES